MRYCVTFCLFFPLWSLTRGMPLLGGAQVLENKYKNQKVLKTGEMLNMFNLFWPCSKKCLKQGKCSNVQYVHFLGEPSMLKNMFKVPPKN